MSKFTLKFCIALLMFSLGVTATFLWFRHNPSPEQYDEVNFAEIPAVEYCELKNNPRRYDGKIIRVKEQLNWFMHGYFIEGRNCSDKNNSGTGDEDRIAVGFFAPKWEEFSNQLDQLQVKNRFAKPVEIVAVGRFSYKYYIGNSDLMQDRTHLQIEIHTIEFATR